MEKALKRVVIEALRSENPNIRRGAALAAGEEHLTGAGPGLVALLKDPQWKVRQAAAVALGKLQENCTNS